MRKLIYLLPVLLLFASCGPKGKPEKKTAYIQDQGMIWNTEFHITYAGPEALRDSVRYTLTKVGNSLSVFDSTSLVSIVNMQDSTPVNTDFIRVYVMSKKINKLTGGAFDPTLSPLISAWGFGPGHKISSDTARIDSLMQFVGIEKTRLRNDALIEDDIRIRFNFSAIAKGYGCDCVGEMFERNGVSDYLVEIGGEIVAAGKNPDGGNWNISIDKPIFNDTAIVHESQIVIGFTDMGLATSGNYRNYHKSDEGIFGHTISSETGRPVQTDVLSATVLASSSMQADALATSFMALGSKKSMEVTGKLRLPVMLVCADTVWMSPQFKNLVKK